MSDFSPIPLDSIKKQFLSYLDNNNNQDGKENNCTDNYNHKIHQLRSPEARKGPLVSPTHSSSQSRSQSQSPPKRFSPTIKLKSNPTTETNALSPLNNSDVNLLRAGPKLQSLSKIFKTDLSSQSSQSTKNLQGTNSNSRSNSASSGGSSNSTTTNKNTTNTILSHSSSPGGKSPIYQLPNSDSKSSLNFDREKKVLQMAGYSQKLSTSVLDELNKKAEQYTTGLEQKKSPSKSSDHKFNNATSIERRFQTIHQKNFNRMDSITNHYSAIRRRREMQEARKREVQAKVRQEKKALSTQPMPRTEIEVEVSPEPKPEPKSEPKLEPKPKPAAKREAEDEAENEAEEGDVTNIKPQQDEEEAIKTPVKDNSKRLSNVQLSSASKRRRTLYGPREVPESFKSPSRIKPDSRTDDGHDYNIGKDETEQNNDNDMQPIPFIDNSNKNESNNQEKANIKNYDNKFEEINKHVEQPQPTAQENNPTCNNYDNQTNQPEEAKASRSRFDEVEKQVEDILGDLSSENAIVKSQSAILRDFINDKKIPHQTQHFNPSHAEGGGKDEPIEPLRISSHRNILSKNTLLNNEAPAPSKIFNRPALASPFAPLSGNPFAAAAPFSNDDDISMMKMDATMMVQDATKMDITMVKDNFSNNYDNANTRANANANANAHGNIYNTNPPDESAMDITMDKMNATIVHDNDFRQSKNNLTKMMPILESGPADQEAHVQITATEQKPKVQIPTSKPSTSLHSYISVPKTMASRKISPGSEALRSSYFSSSKSLNTSSRLTSNGSTNSNSNNVQSFGFARPLNRSNTRSQSNLRQERPVIQGTIRPARSNTNLRHVSSNSSLNKASVTPVSSATQPTNSSSASLSRKSSIPRFLQPTAASLSRQSSRTSLNGSVSDAASMPATSSSSAATSAASTAAKNAAAGRSTSDPINPTIRSTTSNSTITQSSGKLSTQKQSIKSRTIHHIYSGGRQHFTGSTGSFFGSRNSSRNSSNSSSSSKISESSRTNSRDNSDLSKKSSQSSFGSGSSYAKRAQ